MFGFVAVNLVTDRGDTPTQCVGYLTERMMLAFKDCYPIAFGIGKFLRTTVYTPCTESFFITLVYRGVRIHLRMRDQFFKYDFRVKEGWRPAARQQVARRWRLALEQ